MALSQWKEAILEGIFMEIEDDVVEEKNLERLENLVEILHKEGSKVPESVKEAFCKVALECTAKCLTYEKDAKKAYTEAIRSIWLRRIMPLCDKVSCLVTRDLLNSCQRLWTAHSDEKTCKSLMDENTRDKALVSLRKVVSELNPNLVAELNPSMEETEEIESSEESEETESMVEAREIEVIKNSKAAEATDEDQESLSDTELERPTSGGSKAELSPRQINTIPSEVVDRALRKLRASKMELVKALEKEGPSNLNNESITEQENDVANPSGTNIAPRPSLMERRTTAHTYEWEDSLDDSDGELGDDGENTKSKRKRIVVSPSERNQISEGARRKKVPWSTAETLAVLKGFEEYGANWKLIKNENPILERRTNGDIKDKFRVEMKRKSAILE